MSDLVPPPSVSPMKSLQHKLYLVLPKWRLEQVFHSEGRLVYHRPDSQIELRIGCNIVGGTMSSGIATMSFCGHNGAQFSWNGVTDLAKQVDGHIHKLLTREFEYNLLRSVIDAALAGSGLTAAFDLGFSSSYPVSTAKVMKPPDGHFCRLMVRDQSIALFNHGSENALNRFELADPQLLSKIRGATLKLLLRKTSGVLADAKIHLKTLHENIKKQESKISDLEREVCAVEGLVHAAAQFDG